MDEDVTQGTVPHLTEGRPWHRMGVDPTEPMRRHGLWSAFQVINHRVLIRTVAGGAAYVALMVDRQQLPGALGTIAGNDSVLLVCSDPETARGLIGPLADLLGPQLGP